LPRRNLALASFSRHLRHSVESCSQGDNRLPRHERTTLAPLHRVAAMGAQTVVALPQPSPHLEMRGFTDAPNFLNLVRPKCIFRHFLTDPQAAKAALLPSGGAVRRPPLIWWTGLRLSSLACAEASMGVLVKRKTACVRLALVSRGGRMTGKRLSVLQIADQKPAERFRVSKPPAVSFIGDAHSWISTSTAAPDAAVKGSTAQRAGLDRLDPYGNRFCGPASSRGWHTSAMRS
jgi:hypothetical protein